jgi:hypothetical protein
MLRVLSAFQKKFARLYVRVDILPACGESICMAASFLLEGRWGHLQLAYPRYFPMKYMYQDGKVSDM